jgi:hypothetical protein
MPQGRQIAGRVGYRGVFQIDDPPKLAGVRVDQDVVVPEVSVVEGARSVPEVVVGAQIPSPVVDQAVLLRHQGAAQRWEDRFDCPCPGCPVNGGDIESQGELNWNAMECS